MTYTLYTYRFDDNRVGAFTVCPHGDQRRVVIYRVSARNLAEAREKAKEMRHEEERRRGNDPR